MTPENSSTQREAPRRSRMASNLPPLKQRMDPPAVVNGAAARTGTPAVAAPAAKKRMGAPSNPITVPAPESAPLPASATAPTGAGTAPAVTGRKRMNPGAPAADACPATVMSRPASAPDTRPSGDVAAGPLPEERPAWHRQAAVLAGLIVAAVVVVMAARWLNGLAGVREFVTTYDGSATQPDAAPVGIPAWLGWQHFLNIFFMVLIVRTGLQIRTERKPPAYWTAKRGSFFSPKGNTPKKVSLTQWLHQALDVFWVLNGLVFILLLSVTGQWMRIVPSSWDIFPNMLSAAIQYASLDWPTENGWVHYNALQVMAYFITVFMAAPLAVFSGIRMSTWWPENAGRLNKAYPVEWARAIHVPVMVYFLAFTLIHVFLVFFTGALRNLNHMYTSRDVADGWGLAIFLASLLVIAGAWLLARPIFITPAAARTGKISK